MSSENASPTISKKVELPKFSPEDISFIIGPSKKSCDENPQMKKLPSLKKKVIQPAWNSYKTYQSSLEGDDGENKVGEKVFVKLSRGMNKEKKEVVLATIECNTEEMYKFIMLHLNKYQDSFRKPQKKMFHSIYATFPQHLIPILIGSRGSCVTELKDYASEFMDESFEENIDTCKRSFLKIQKFEPKDRSDFFENMNTEKGTFIGGHPGGEEDMIKISVSSFAEKDSFKNFVECLSDVVMEKIDEIISRNNEREEKRNREREEDLAECMEALDSSW